MTTTYPLPTLAATITSTGISAPPYSDIYQSLLASYQVIFGADAYVAPDSQDGQLLAVFARAISDSNDMAIAVYNGFSPATAQGVGLSSVVKINGITRMVASNSQVNVMCVGTVGATITNGLVADTSGNLWNLPASVVIPLAGQILVTATAQALGAISAPIGTVNVIQTPTLGWNSVSNPAAATPGNPVETDAALRIRQAASVSLPAMATLASIAASVRALSGVTQVAAYENDTNATDSNGMPPHSIGLVVSGGVSADIATTILNKKAPGASTVGNTSTTVVDMVGLPHTVSYYVPAAELITVVINLHPLSSNYTTAIGVQVTTAILNYINSLLIGQTVYRDRLFLPAQLFGATDSLTFNIVSILIALSPGSPAAADVGIAFNQRAYTTSGSITLNLV